MMVKPPSVPASFEEWCRTVGRMAYRDYVEKHERANDPPKDPNVATVVEMAEAKGMTPKMNATALGIVRTTSDLEVRFVKILNGVEVRIPNRGSPEKDAFATMRFVRTGDYTKETVEETYLRARAFTSKHLQEVHAENLKREIERKALDRFPAELIVIFREDGTDTGAEIG